MNKGIACVEHIARSIFAIRGQKVMLDFDLAALYGVPTGHLNRAVKRNIGRFPVDFMFQLGAEEARNLTEQGVAMLSSVLNSARAVKVNIAIMRTFVRLREALETNRELARKFDELEKRVGGHDKQIDGIIEAIRQLMAPTKKPHREIGFHVREKSPCYRTRKVRTLPI
jgi:hypothetical protein